MSSAISKSAPKQISRAEEKEYARLSKLWACCTATKQQIMRCMELGRKAKAACAA